MIETYVFNSHGAYYRQCVAFVIHFETNLLLESKLLKIL